MKSPWLIGYVAGALCVVPDSRLAGTVVCFERKFGPALQTAAPSIAHPARIVAGMSHGCHMVPLLPGP